MNMAFIIVLQETHCTTADKLVIPNFSLAGSILSRNHGLVTFAHERLEWSLVDQSSEQSETEWLCVDFAGYKIVNVYKPPRSRLTPTTIPTFPHPSLYVGDFNCQHVNWGYNTTSPDGESLDSWATSNKVGLLYNPKKTASFFSRRWNVGTNPDLAFASFGQDSRLPDRRVLEKFPRSQHRPSLITPPRFKVPAHSDTVKRWNLRKADWKCFCLLTGESVKRMPPPDTPDIERAYQDFRESLLSAAKQCIPRGCRKKYVPCWDKECETLYRSFSRAPVGTVSGRAASSLLPRLQQKKQERWEEAVNPFDFSHSSCKAWRTINKLTGRSGRSSRLCPVSATSIASQLVMNGAHKTGGCESTRLVNKQLSDLWKIPTPDGHSISEPFRQEEFAAALRHMKPRKSPRMDSIFWDFIHHAGSALKSFFATSSIPARTNSKFLKSGEEH